MLDRQELIDSLNKDGSVPVSFVWECYQENAGKVKDLNTFLNLFRQWLAINVPLFDLIMNKYEVNSISKEDRVVLYY